MIRGKQNNWQQPKLCFQDTMDRSIDKAVSFIFFDIAQSFQMEFQLIIPTGIQT